MRQIEVAKISEIVKELCVKANTELNQDVLDAFKTAAGREESEVGRAVLRQLLENAEIARQEAVPICQDTGFAVLFLEVGQEVAFVGGSLKEALAAGVRAGYSDGYLRKSIVKNPLTAPENTKDNTPPIIHIDLVEGDQVKITVLPKGGGAENMSRVKMMTPADGVAGVKQFVVDTVTAAGANPCPPIIVGVGMGGTFDYVAFLAKKSLLRKMGQRNPDQRLAELETEWLAEINKIGIGPGGMGGKVTALELFIEEFPRHIASYPAAVNIQCNAARSKTYIL